MYELNIFWILWIIYVHIMNGKKACKWKQILEGNVQYYISGYVMGMCYLQTYLTP